MELPGKIIRFWRDDRTGFILGLLVVGGLILGSVVMNFNPKQYPAFFPVEFGMFFHPPRPIHFWFYLLLVLLFLLGGSIFFSTLESVLRMVRTGIYRARTIAIILIHLAIIIALAGHLLEGMGGVTFQSALGDRPAPLGAMGTAKIIGLEELRHPDGSLKDVVADLSFQLTGKGEQKKSISYNSPALFSWGTEEVLILQGMKAPQGLVLKKVDGEERLRLEAQSPVNMDEGTLELMDFGRMSRDIIFARLRWKPRRGEGGMRFVVCQKGYQSHSTITVGANLYQYERLIEQARLIVQVKINPGIPLFILAFLIMTVGLVLLTRHEVGKRVRRLRQPASDPESART